MKRTAGKISQGLITTAMVSVCLASLVTPLSTSLLGAFSALSVCTWILGGGLVELPETFKRNPSTFVALLLFGFMIVAITYSPASKEEAFSVLKKYRELLLLPPVFCLLSGSATYRGRATGCFLTGCIGLMVLSYLFYFDLLQGDRYGYSLVFHITHSFFMAVLGYWSLHLAMQPGWSKYFWWLVCAAAVINLVYIAPGRTGMFVFCCLTLLFLYQRLSFGKWLASLLIFAAVLAGAYHSSHNLSSRVDEALQEIQRYQPGHSKTSVGQRFDWWKTSFDLFKKQPLIGHGTGSYRILHKAATAGTDITPTDNPHNEFLFLAVQYGIIGLLLFLLIIGLQIYESRKAPVINRYLFQGVVLALLSGSLMNSLLFDSQQGHFYLFMSAALLAGND